MKQYLSSPLFNYIVKVFIGFTLGYSVYVTYPQYELFWALISIILVISPEEVDTKKLTIERVKANFVGSISGIIVFFLPFSDWVKLTAGILLAILICKYFNLMKVARSAVVAILIVLIEHQSDSIHTPIARFLAVATGCFIGLGVSLLVAFIRDMILKKTN